MANASEKSCPFRHPAPCRFTPASVVSPTAAGGGLSSPACWPLPGHARLDRPEFPFAVQPDLAWFPERLVGHRCSRGCGCVLQAVLVSIATLPGGCSERRLDGGKLDQRMCRHPPSSFSRRHAASVAG